MPTTFEFRTLTATLVFDLRDDFASRRGTRGPFPRPFEPLRLLATAKIVGPNREEFEPPLELIVKRNGNGYHVFHNSIKRPDGGVLKKALADGRYDLRIEGDFYQPAVLTNVDIPDPTPKTPMTFNLLPAYNYPFPLDLKPTGGRGFALLRGSLHTREGAPLPGARVNVVGAISDYITGNVGQWVLVFPDTFFPGATTTRNVTVAVTPATGPPINVPNVSVDKGTERSLAETALRGWVLARAVGVPGAVVEVQGQPGQTLTAVDGSWFYYFGLDQSSSISVDVMARLPDGSTLTQTNQQVQPRATAIVPPFQFP